MFFWIILIGQFWFELLSGRAYHLNGFMSNTGIMAGFLSISIPILLSLTDKTKSNLILPVIYSIIALITIIASGSRTAIVALLFTLFFFYIIKQRKQIVLYIVAASAILLISTIVLYSLRPDSFKGRLLIWKIGSDMIDCDSFIFGKGLGFVENKFITFQEAYFSSAIRTKNEKLLAGDTHSLFNETYRIIVESGLIGFLTFVGILFFFFKITLGKSGVLRNQVLFAMALTTLLVFGSFSYPLQSVPIFVLFFCIISFASSTEIVNSDYRIYTMLNIIRLPVLCCITITILVSTLGAYQRYFDLENWRKLKEGAWEYNEAHAWSSYKKLEETMSNDALFLSDFGLSLQKNFYYKQAQPLLNKAALLSPSVNNLSQVAFNYSLIQKPTLAEQYYKKAINSIPKLFTPKHFLFQLYSTTNQQQKAMEIALDIMNSPIKVPSPEIKKIKSSAITYLTKNNPMIY